MADNIPAWLTAKADQRIALLDETKLPQYMQGENTAIVMALTEPGPDATPEQRATWERTCDNCGKDCKDDGFWTGSIETAKGTVTVLLTFGVCANCRF